MLDDRLRAALADYRDSDSPCVMPSTLAQWLEVSTTEIAALVTAGDLPRPVLLAGEAVWAIEDLRALLWQGPIEPLWQVDESWFSATESDDWWPHAKPEIADEIVDPEPELASLRDPDSFRTRISSSELNRRYGALIRAALARLDGGNCA